jgi:hypothetical protein
VGERTPYEQYKTSGDGGNTYSFHFIFFLYCNITIKSTRSSWPKTTFLGVDRDNMANGKGRSPGRQEVQAFTGSEAYLQHKAKRFPAADRAIPIAQNQAFLLDDPAIRDDYRRRYERTAAIYYRGQPPFDELLSRIKNNVDRL